MTLQIVDSHFHIWRQQDLPWLLGPMVPRIFGPYEPVRRDYLIEEYLQDQAGANVVGAVYVQTNWPVRHFEEEARWVQDVAQRTGWPHAMVAYAPMTEGDVRPQLERLSRYGLVRGVREQLHWHENPAYRFAAVPGQVNSDIFRRNIERLKDFGYSFDLQLFPDQMADGARLAADHPAVEFILVHAGMLEDTSAEGLQRWRAGMQGLAKNPNVSVKLSGLGTFIHRNDPGHIATVVRNCVEIFGAGRCMFGSNFPIEKIWTGHPALIAAHLDALAPFDTQQKDAVLRGTAARVYRLDC